MIPISILDLVHIVEGSDATQAFQNSVELAQHAEALDFNRVWYAEHHNMRGIASSATSVLIAHIANQTKSIRLGAGGVMLSNHSPLAIAEQFGTLATLHPDRMDLGVGRAPGGDQETMWALRRNKHAGDNFPKDVNELLRYLDVRDFGASSGVSAIPGEGTQVPLWILGSSLFGAQLAADMGLPYAFASHFAPQQLVEAAELYRKTFKPSKYLDRPYFMVAANVFAADTEEDAHYHFSSLVQAFAAMVQGKRKQLPEPVEGLMLPELIEERVNNMLAISAVGTKEMVADQLQIITDKLKPDEIIVSSAFYDPSARLRSMELIKEVNAKLN